MRTATKSPRFTPLMDTFSDFPEVSFPKYSPEVMLVWQVIPLFPSALSSVEASGIPQVLLPSKSLKWREISFEKPASSFFSLTAATETLYGLSIPEGKSQYSSLSLLSFPAANTETAPFCPTSSISFSKISLGSPPPQELLMATIGTPTSRALLI